MVAAPFRDLSEAFDTISHEILLENLEISGFDQIAMRLIKSYLSNKTQKVVVQNTSSELIDLYLRLITTFYLKKKVSVFFHSIKCLMVLAKTALPEVRRIIERDMNVNDQLPGGDLIEKALALQTELIELLQTAGFQS